MQHTALMVFGAGKWYQEAVFSGTDRNPGAMLPFQRLSRRFHSEAVFGGEG